MKNTIFVKLGGSLITDKSKPYTVREDVVKRLAREIHEARVEGNIKLLVGHGGGSFPHVSAQKYETHRGAINDKSWEGFAKVQNDAAKLNRIIVNSLIEAGENAFSVQPSASCIAKNDQIVDWYTRPIKAGLEQDLIPVPYGDVCIDMSKGCCIISTEEILRFLSDEFKPSRIIMVGKTEGVFDSNGKLIKIITKSNFDELEEAFKSSDGVADVTGGMMVKVKKALDMGIEVEIINGLQGGLLKKVLMGEKGFGTIIRG
ncbi:MAG: isopentenyl phosphate kinase family protein [Candidatus Aenigmarchaeota archaeon]|nr:isopentenyl phosphate kinase family protein [Candidatus Aenigmarchaeota archaeon]